MRFDTARSWGVFLAAVPLAGLFVFSPVHGQPWNDSAPEEIQRVDDSKSGPRFSDGELSSFARAYIEVTQLRTIYDARMFTASTPDKADQLAEELESRTTQIIQEEGLDVTTYGRIIGAMETNDRVREKVNQFLTNQP